jgi:phage shock protein A
MAAFAAERAQATQQDTPASLALALGVPTLAAQYLLALRSEIGQLSAIIQEQSETNDALNLSLHEQENRIKNLEMFIARSENGKGQ